MAKTVIIHQKKKKKHELKGPHKPRLKDNQHFLGIYETIKVNRSHVRQLKLVGHATF